MNRRSVKCILGIVALAVVESASAGFTWSGTGTGNDGSGLAASAAFDIVNGELQVTIANTATVPTSHAANVLTAVYFTGAAGVTGVDTEYIPKDSKVFHNTDGAITLSSDTFLPTSFFEVKAEQWQFKFKNSTDGLGSAGLGFFNGGAVSKDGLVSKTYTPTDGLSHDGDVVFENSIVIRLSGFTGQLSDISNVKFQYGTTTGDPSFVGTVVPESSTYIAGAFLLLPFGMSALRVLRKDRIA